MAILFNEEETGKETEIETKKLMMPKHQGKKKVSPAATGATEGVRPMEQSERPRLSHDILQRFAEFAQVKFSKARLERIMPGVV